MDINDYSNHARSLLDKQDVAAFNAFRLETLSYKLDCRNLNFTDWDMPKIMLVNVDLTNTVFDEVDLESAIFSGSDLTNTAFYNSGIREAIFGVPYLININLPEELQRFLLTPPILTETDFLGTDLSESTFRQARFEKTDFTGTYLYAVDFRSTNHQDAIFDRAEFDKCIFDAPNK